MNNLLNKFQAVTISNDNRISEKDRVYCEKHEKMYNEALAVLQQALTAFKTIYSTYEKDQFDYAYGYIEKSDDIRHTEDRIIEVKKTFIQKIIFHFEKAYKISLEHRELYNKYDITVTYKDIVNEVFDQLGGFNFTEKAIREIKDDIANGVRHDKVEVNKNKLIIKGFVYIDHFDKKWGKIRMSYSSRDKVYRLFKALSHFETGELEPIWYYQNVRQSLNEDDCFTKYDLGYEKVKSFKPFQNGKVEIVFQTMEQALEFSKEYLNQ